MKARIIKENSYRKITDYASVGDRITDVGSVYDENGTYVGMSISTGCVTKMSIHFESNILIPVSGLTDEKAVPIMLEKFAYGKYILCSDDNVAEFISELKRDLASEGIKFGEIFTYHTETPQEIAIKGFLDY